MREGDPKRRSEAGMVSGTRIQAHGLLLGIFQGRGQIVDGRGMARNRHKYGMRRGRSLRDGTGAETETEM